MDFYKYIRTGIRGTKGLPFNGPKPNRAFRATLSLLDTVGYCMYILVILYVQYVPVVNVCCVNHAVIEYVMSPLQTGHL